MTRQADRTPEADAQEARLRQMPAEALPDVDVFIATYNEEYAILERMIIGAASMDWPRERLHVWVLDDGKRDWLRDLAAREGVGYLRRDTNEDAKAGNINAAIARTSAPFFLVLDADFIPQQQFLMRAIGFFQDPHIGIVQAPHYFFNSDVIQAGLKMDQVVRDDQRLFFENIMSGRDGWDAAFCCGSNGIVRRAAIDRIGSRLPSGSVTRGG